MKFNESTECLVSSFIPFKYLERDLYIVPYLSLCHASVKSHHPVKAMTFSHSAQMHIAEHFRELRDLKLAVSFYG